MELRTMRNAHSRATSRCWSSTHCSTGSTMSGAAAQKRRQRHTPSLAGSVKERDDATDERKHCQNLTTEPCFVAFVAQFLLTTQPPPPRSSPPPTTTH